MKRTSLKSILLAASFAVSLGPVTAIADTAEPAALTQFTAHADTSGYAVRYQPIAQFTQAFAQEERGRTKIAYAAVNQQGMRFLTQYVRYLQDVPVEQLSRDDQLAFWLNTRNMLIVQAMTESNSRRRMQRNRGTAAEPGEMWTEARINIDGVDLSINDIEQGIILANWADTPNVIYGLYQGTQGGASYPAQGFSGANVHAELEELGRDFVNSRSGIRIRRSKAQIPAIYDWYGDAFFGSDQDALVAHLTSLSSADTSTKLAAATSFESRKFNYSSDEFVIRQQSAPSTGGFSGGGGGGSYGS